MKYYFLLLFFQTGWLVGQASKSIEETVEFNDVNELSKINATNDYYVILCTTLKLKALEDSDLLCFLRPNHLEDGRTQNLSGIVELTFSDESSSGEEKILSSRSISFNPGKGSQELRFQCGLFVQGGNYIIRVKKVLEDEETESYYTTLASATIKVEYPTIEFDVPRRLDAYTTSVIITFGLTGSFCKPIVPLPKTDMVLTHCYQFENDGPFESYESLDKIDDSNGTISHGNFHGSSDCFQDFTPVYANPLEALARDGRLSITVDCKFWGKNATFRLQIREAKTNVVIARSSLIKVDWGNRFSIKLRQKNIHPCRNSLQVVVSYPRCVLAGKDKIRIYGFMSLAVPSLLAPNQRNYIGEQLIKPNARILSFKCDLFPQKFSRFCFQYVNTAVDNSVNVVSEICVPTTNSDKLSDGGWSPWKEWSRCETTCDKNSKRFRYRFCDSPPPSSPESFCQGNSVEEQNCASMIDCLGPGRPTINSDLRISAEELFSTPLPDLDTSMSSTADSSDVEADIFSLFEEYDIHMNASEECNCGCIIQGLHTEKNYTLLVQISSQESMCLNTTSDPHWIFLGDELDSKVKVVIPRVFTKCMILTFRDGDSSDSDILDVASSEEEPPSGLIAVESSTNSLYLQAKTDALCDNDNKYLYFFAHYSVLIPDEIERETWLQLVSDTVSAYDFWTLVFFRTIVVCFIVVIVGSLLGGFFTKRYFKYQYSQMRKHHNCEDPYLDDEDVNELDETKGECETDVLSDRTSVTFMPQDYRHWKRRRGGSKRKGFLVRPKKLNITLCKVKSLPASPFGARNKKYIPYRSKHAKGISRSFSDTNILIRRKSKDSKAHRASWSKKPKRYNKKYNEQGTNSSSMSKLKLDVPILEAYDESKSSSFAPSGGSKSSNSRAQTNLKPAVDDASKNGRTNEKMLKDAENLKRRVTTTVDSKGCLRKQTDKEKFFDGQECSDSWTPDRSKMASQLSISTLQSDKTGSKMELDAATDQEFEMDYFDYDVGNVGNIPGSYFGLEPSFVLWNSEVCTSDVEEQNEELLKKPPLAIDEVDTNVDEMNSLLGESNSKGENVKE